ncbi:MAG: HAD family hydrolase [Eubacterium sp.]|nr:HAD family hydrolase [Eubacterium sp.]
MSWQTMEEGMIRRRSWPHVVIFDMDGLMYKTEQMIQDAWNIVGPDIIGFPLGDELYHTMGMNRALRVQYFEERFGKSFPYTEFEKRYKAIVTKKKMTEGIPVQKGLFELLACLSEEKIPMVLATGSSSIHTYLNMRVTHTPNVFRVIICGDMVKAAKPDPYIYHLSCEKLDMKPDEVLVLEDSVNGVKAAYAAGTPVIMIPDLQKDTAAVDAMYLKKMDSLLNVRDYIQKCLGMCVKNDKTVRIEE